MVAEVERVAALDAVRAAASMTADVQGRLGTGGTIFKGDASPVTVADFAAQAIVAAVLTERLGAIELVGEESPADLVEDAALFAAVGALVRTHGRAGATDDDVVGLIGAGDGDGTTSRFWTLDPIDGTKGFLRGDQYAIALALIDGGEVVLGVLGCPNLPNADGTRGAIFVAHPGGCDAWFGGAAGPVPVRVAHPAALSAARFCESVEAAHSSHDDAAAVADRLGITAPPFRIDSQCKYGAVARGDASIYLRLPTRPGYREQIWDHAAGKLVVERAGGTVTDVDGRALTFGSGRRLEQNRGVVATDGRFHADVLSAVADVLGGT